MAETFQGFVATGCGSTWLTVALDGAQATVAIRSRWMGDAAPLEVALSCRHHRRGSHSGVLIVAAAEGLVLPPSDGEILLEYVQLPSQPAGGAGSGAMAAAGDWNESFSFLIWLHRDAVFDRGDELPPEAYDTPIACFEPVARALELLNLPWKLEALAGD